MAQLLSMGELLIDFTPTGVTEDGRLLFARNPGGAPANVAVQAHRAGVSAGFLGRVGNDMFGNFLADVLDSCGVDTAGLTRDDEYSTTLAFVQLSESGDRDFSFYRDPGADTRLSYEVVDKKLIDDCTVLCFGSLLLTSEPSRSTVKDIVKEAKEKGEITAYDPNWRPPLWKDKAEGIEQMRSLVPYADIMKVSDEELALITDKTNMESGAKALLEQGVSVVIVTLGAEGCAAFTRDISLRRNTYDTKVVDTTGSGDSFFGSFLSRLIKSGKKPNELTEAELSDFLDFANAAGSLCAEKQGAIPAIPTEAEIENCRKTTPLLVK